jgi:hypothetical protein
LLLLLLAAADGCTIAAGTLTCTWPSLPVGQTRTLRVTTKPVTAGTINNPAVVKAENEDPLGFMDNKDISSILAVSTVVTA